MDFGENKVFCTITQTRRFAVTKCSHFEEAPKSWAEQSVKAQELVKKGKPPRKQPKKKESGSFLGFPDTQMR